MFYNKALQYPSNFRNNSYKSWKTWNKNVKIILNTHDNKNKKIFKFLKKKKNMCLWKCISKTIFQQWMYEWENSHIDWLATTPHYTTTG